MKSYVTLILVACVCVSLAELILPQGKIKKCACVALSAVFALTAAYPLAKNEISESFSYAFGEVFSAEYDKAVNDVIEDNIKTSYAKGVKSRLLDVDLVAERVEVEYCRGLIEKIDIYLSNAVFTDESKHIDNNVIADYVCKELNLDRGKVSVYA